MCLLDDSGHIEYVIEVNSSGLQLQWTQNHSNGAKLPWNHHGNGTRGMLIDPQSSLCKQSGGGNPLAHLSVFSIDFFDRFNHIGELSAVLVQPLYISHA